MRFVSYYGVDLEEGSNLAHPPNTPPPKNWEIYEKKNKKTINPAQNFFLVYFGTKKLQIPHKISF